MPIAIEALARLVYSQCRHQGLGGTDARKVPKQLLQRCAVIPPAQSCAQRMLMRINRGESIDAHQGRKKQRLKAPPQRLRAVMEQGKVVARMRVLMGLSPLRELLHHRAKEIRLVEPSGTQMHAHRR
jgi:hypothetical protein